MPVMYLEVVLGEGELDGNKTLTGIDRLRYLPILHAKATIGSSSLVQSAVIAEVGEAMRSVFSAEPVVVERVSEAICPLHCFDNDSRHSFLAHDLVLWVWSVLQDLDDGDGRPPHQVSDIGWGPLSTWVSLEVSRIDHECSGDGEVKLDGGMLSWGGRCREVLCKVGFEIVDVLAVEANILGMGIFGMTTTRLRRLVQP